jgi:hypothetical protein
MILTDIKFFVLAYRYRKHYHKIDCFPDNGKVGLEVTVRGIQFHQLRTAIRKGFK